MWTWRPRTPPFPERRLVRLVRAEGDSPEPRAPGPPSLRRSLVPAQPPLRHRPGPRRPCGITAGSEIRAPSHGSLWRQRWQAAATALLSPELGLCPFKRDVPSAAGWAEVYCVPCDASEQPAGMERWEGGEAPSRAGPQPLGAFLRLFSFSQASAPPLWGGRMVQSYHHGRHHEESGECGRREGCFFSLGI